MNDHLKANQIKFFSDLPLPAWRVWLTPFFFIEGHKPPNIMHRVLQRLFFGFRWERTKYAKAMHTP
jgi:hypothetical protein